MMWTTTTTVRENIEYQYRTRYRYLVPGTRYGTVPRYVPVTGTGYLVVPTVVVSSI